MAVGTGIGLDLTALNDAFKAADQHIKNLTDKTNGLQKETIKAFQQMAQKGVLPYVEALKQQKKYLEEIGKAKGSGAFFTKMQKEAKATVDEINKVISSLEKTTSFRNEASGKSSMSFAKSVLGKGGEAKSIDNMRKALQQLEDAQNRQNLGTARGRKNYEKIGETIRRVKEELDKATGANTRLRQESDKTKDAFKGLGSMISAAFALNAIRQFVTEMIRVRGEFEMQHRSLQVLLQDKEAADALWDKTVQLAVKSPFRVKDLVTYTKNLAAYRVEADKLYETNKMLADVSAGLGVDMNRLILAFGQVKAANFLRGTELRQFSEAGVNMLEELAKRFTMLEGRAVSVGEVFERVSKRMVSFKDVESVFKTITSEGGVFYQMQEKQSETLRGMIMNLKDSIDLMFNKMGESNDSMLKNSVKLVAEFVNNWEKLKPVINGVTMALVTTLVGHGIAKVISGFSDAARTVRILWKVIAQGAKMHKLTAGPWIALATVLVGVVTTIAQAVNSANRLQKELNKVYAEDTQNLDKSIARYQDLVNRLRQTNQGSQERRDIIEKINNEYGKYLDFIVTEQTEISKLVDSYDILVKRMKEKAAASTYEKAFAVISDEYQKKMLDAQKDFEKILSGENFFMKEMPLEAYGLMQKGKNLFGGETAASIMPTKQEINDIYAILEQRLEKVTEEEEKQLKKVKAQKELINSIVSSYYGKEFYIRFAEGDKDIDIIETILEKKAKEREIEEQISRAYQESLKSRQARLEYQKLELEYTQKQAEIKDMKDTSPFEVDKMLNKLREEFELNKIEIKFKFGQIGKEERDRLRDSILNWATATTKDVNDEIRRQLSDFMGESEWSNFLITPDKQAQGISGIIKEITNGYETQVNVIKEQISLKSAGRKIDEKGLEFAEKQKRAYEVVANILGIELKTQNRISDSLLKQINDLMPAKQKLSLEDSYKSVKEIQDETSKSYKEQVEIMTTLINQKRAGVDIDDNALEVAREDLEILREKMKMLGAKVEEPMSETTRNSINYFLPEEFKVSQVDALKGIVEVNKAAATAFENAQKEYDILIKAQKNGTEGLEDQILLLESQIPYLQRKVELTGTEIKDRLTETQLWEINSQLSEEYQLGEINLYKSRSTILSEVQAKEKEITDAILSAKNMREDGLTVEDEYISKLEEEYIMYKRIQDLVGTSNEKPIDQQRMYDINAKLDESHKINVIDSQKSEVTLLQEANTQKEKAIAYEAQLVAMKKQGVTVTDAQLAKAKEEVKQWTLRWKLLGGTDKDKTGDERQNSLYDERIKVIDDMNKKYRELARTLPDVEAKQGAFNAYIDAFAEAYKDIQWIPKNVKEMSPEQFANKVLNFPNEDALVAFLDKLAEEPMKAFEKIKVELAKGKYVLDMKVRVQQDADKKVIEQVEQMFEEYDLSLEIDKLNIPPSLAKDLFGISTKSLKELKEGVTDAFMGVEMYSERIKDAGKLMEDSFNGNVDLLQRKLIPTQQLAEKGWKNVGEGLATVFSSSYSVTDASGKEIDILVTPILPDGTVMSEKELEDYISKNLEGAANILEADNKGVVIHAAVDMDESLGEYLHSLQEVFYASEMLSKDQKEKFKDFLDKIADMEDTAAKERMKTYSKYLLKGMSERVKLKIEELRKLKEIEESDKFTPEQKERIKAGVSKEARAEQQKQEWKDFQGSDMYTMMFEDLEHYGSAAIDALYKKLSELKTSLSDLPTSEVKEIVGQIEKLENIKIERNPFESLKTYKNEVKNIGFSEDELQNMLMGEVNIEKQAQDIIDVINIVQQSIADGGEEAKILQELTPEQLRSWEQAKNIQQQTGETLDGVVKRQERIVKKSKEHQTTIVGQQKAYKKLDKSQEAALKETEVWLNAVGDVFSASKELMESLGVESDSVAMTIADTGSSMVSLILSAVQFTLQLQAMGVAANSALGIIGWIAIALQAVATALSAIFSAKDKALQKEIDGHLARAEKLHEKYEELSDAIDSAYDASVVRQLNKEIEKTIQLEIKAIEAAIAAEKSQKDSKIDWGWVDEQEKKVKELYNTLNEEHDNYIERWGGFGSDEARLDFIESMTQAWLDSFKETGDGLDGLEEKWDEYFDNLAMKQMALRVSKAAIDKYLAMWDKYVSEESAGGEDLTEAEAQDLRLKKEQLLKDLSERYTSLAESLGITPTTEGGGLSSLQKGIQGITEDQADILASYWNSVRGYTASIDSKMDLVLANLGAGAEGNPMLAQLMMVARNTSAINTLLSSLVKSGHTLGGSGIKVFMS